MMAFINLNRNDSSKKKNKRELSNAKGIDITKKDNSPSFFIAKVRRKVRRR